MPGTMMWRKSTLEKAADSGLCGGGVRVSVKTARRRVVRAADSPVAALPARAGVDLARLEHFLSEWAYWMTKGGGVRGYGGQTPGFVNSRTSSSFEDLCDDMDKGINRTMDAVIRGLAQHEQDAIWKAYGVLSVWRYARLDSSKVLEDAKRNIADGLTKKGVPL
jgi:hypothetical protein